MADGTGHQRLFPDWKERHLPAGWTPDGKLLLWSRGQYWMALHARLFARPQRVQLSPGEPIFSSIVQVRDSRTFYAVGTTPLGQLQRFDTNSRTWVPHLGGISAESVEYSRDRRRVLYTTFPEGELWIRNADGSQPIQLTEAPMLVDIGRWSPDGRIIAFTGKSSPDQPWRIYLVDPSAGNRRAASFKEYLAGDFAWMPDGKKLLFAAPTARFATEEPYLHVLDLATGEIAKFPGSDGLYSPRISPDNSTLAAEVWPSQELTVYQFSERVWRKLARPGPGITDWESWSRDSKSIWYWDGLNGGVFRCHVRENRHEEMLELKYEEMLTAEPEEMAGLVGYWFSLTPNDEPMILRRHDIQQIYALDWKSR
jgi:Tol biopolymer transport system component